jgi:hypothetical protein
MTDGLVPSMGARSSEFGEPESRLYLFPSRDDAETAVSSWLGDSFDEDEPLALLQVRAQPSGSEVEWEYFTTEIIPPADIEVVDEDF